MWKSRTSKVNSARWCHLSVVFRLKVKNRTWIKGGNPKSRLRTKKAIGNVDVAKVVGPFLKKSSRFYACAPGNHDTARHFVAVRTMPGFRWSRAGFVPLSARVLPRQNLAWARRALRLT